MCSHGTIPTALCSQNFIGIEELQELGMIVALKEISKDTGEGESPAPGFCIGGGDCQMQTDKHVDKRPGPS